MQTLLQQMQDKFQTMSDQIIGRNIFSCFCYNYRVFQGGTSSLRYTSNFNKTSSCLNEITSYLADALSLEFGSPFPSLGKEQAFVNHDDVNNELKCHNWDGLNWQMENVDKIMVKMDFVIVLTYFNFLSHKYHLLYHFWLLMS